MLHVCMLEVFGLMWFRYFFWGGGSFNPKIGEDGVNHHFGPKKSRRSKEVVPAYLSFARNPEIPLAMNMKNPLSFSSMGLYLNRCDSKGIPINY